MNTEQFRKTLEERIATLEDLGQRTDFLEEVRALLDEYETMKFAPNEQALILKTIEANTQIIEENTRKIERATRSLEHIEALEELIEVTPPR